MMVSSFNSIVLKAKEAIVSRTDQGEAQRQNLQTEVGWRGSSGVHGRV
jgi:hypothetical protein